MKAKTIKSLNVGLWADRLNPERDNPREIAFAEQWERDNSCRVKIGGHEPHLLNPLLYGIGVDLNDSTVTLNPDGLERDRIVAATVIQWLGSNVGFDFLRQSLDRFGCRIVDKDGRIA